MIYDTKLTMLPEEYVIEKKSRFTRDTYLFRVKTKMKSEPGQFVQVYIPGVGEAPISICSDDPKYTELLVRNVGNATDKMCDLKPGDKILLRGPYGKGYPMEELKHQNLTVIGGGTGVAPPRSVVEYIHKHREDFDDIRIFLGFRDPHEILFKRDIEKWQKNFDVHLTVDKAEEHYKGKVGLITNLLDEVKFPTTGSFVLCGPPIMIKFVIKSLLEKGVNERQIYISHERHMKCGVGKCGHCMIKGVYVCRDGPVFNYAEMGETKE